MVKIAVLSMALAASMVSAAAAPLKCTPNTLYCGFTLENGKFIYNRQDLIAALIVAGEDPNVQGIIQHSRFNCTDDKGTIATSPQLFCGDQKCVEPNPGNPEAPGPNAVCKK